MKRLHSATAKVVAVLLAYLPFRFVIYFLAIKIGLPHTNLIELLSEIYIALAGIYLLAANYKTVWTKLRSPRQWPRIIKLAITLVIWGLVTLSYTPAGFGQALRGLRLDFLGLGILVLVWLVPTERDDAKPLFELAYWACIVIAVVGLIELVFGPGFLHALGFSPYQFFAGKIRQVHSLLPTPNMFGSAMVLLTALVYKRLARPSWWMTLGLGILVGSSYSRSAWLALAILGAAIFFHYLGRGIFAWSVGFLALGLALGTLLGIMRYHGSFESAATHDASTAQHQTAYVGAAQSFTNFDITWFTGDGIGSAGPATLNSKQPPRIAESWYIQLFQEMGVIGLGLFIAIMLVLTNQLFDMGEPILAFVTIALSINALFLHIWADDRFVHILFWSLMSITLFSRPKAKPRTA